MVVGSHPLCASWLLDIGDRVAFAGPSKSGKSLQLEILAGEVPIESGEQGSKSWLLVFFSGTIRDPCYMTGLCSYAMK